MRDEEFKAWLASGGVTEKAQNTRAYAVRKIEQQLNALRFSWPDLEAAFAEDGFAAIRAKLGAMRQDAKEGGEDFRILLPDSQKPLNRLSSWALWLRQYGRFLAGEPNKGSDADVIRAAVLEMYIEPARKEGLTHIELRVRELNDTLELNEAWANICQALQGEKFREMANVPCPDRFGANMSSTTIFRFWLDEDARAKAALEHFTHGHQKFEAIFSAWSTEQQSLFLRLILLIHDAGFDWYHAKIPPYELRFGRKEKEKVLAYPSLGCLRKTPPVLTVYDKKADGKGLGEQADYPLDEIGFAAFAQRFAKEAPEEMRRSPLPDKRLPYWPDDLQDSPATSDEAIQDETSMIAPTNEILYGPPGTGKTYATARRAVELCGEEAPEDRGELMEVYNRLRADKRIEFVTFHQSFSYEDFVEGLRPPMDDEGEDEEALVQKEASGLRLKVHKGIFRDMAERASLDAGASSPLTLDATRPIFKVALGERGTEEAQILAALDQDEITLGWGGHTDWSDPRFDKLSEILSQWRADGHPDATGKDANVEQIFGFRSWMQAGDYVVVSDGRDRFRALGQVTGPYVFDPHLDRHPHRRRVQWLWRDDQGQDRDRFYPRWFRRHSFYRLAPDAIDWAGLSAIVLGKDTKPLNQRPYVLVIDEINRANVSRVFGELITLIEPDKRLGQTNALEVRLPYSQKLFGVPGNLHILGTMNTADRSVALLDTALRRRFEFTELEPDATKLKDRVPGLELDLVLHTINQRLEYLIDRDHRVGHAFFMHCTTQGDVDQVMRRKVLPLLQEYFFEDWSMIAAVMGNGFIRRDDLPVPPGLEGRAVRREAISWSVRETFDEDAYGILIGRIASPSTQDTDEEG
ncbi:AAA family ATPase [Novosphingobium sp. KA1]|uniref:AAA family ATPase n=1 Tax=Novosphingobium sp. (strain KA1) TaxID=164608 RepID=UPI001A8D411F|nr:AAA family ATPase [Novosphingobium sp. KA1]QSR17442.1 hypothetical protein CA833_09645 [Novosphingobium sp. KA1]